MRGEIYSTCANMTPKLSSTHINTCYRSLEDRLDSFRDWNVPFLEARVLAACGFYYTGYSDRVRCFECSVELCYWQEGDDPLKEHRLWAARCEFARRLYQLTANNENSDTTSNDLKCKICFANNMNIVALPCRHFAVCQYCVENIENCVICRSKIAEKMRVYVA